MPCATISFSSLAVYRENSQSIAIQSLKTMSRDGRLRGNALLYTGDVEICSRSSSGRVQR
jgi:hypothetical protein